MKKTRIPDFSPTRKGAPATGAGKGATKPARVPRAPGIKPQATSAKSGRRGT